MKNISIYYDIDGYNVTEEQFKFIEEKLNELGLNDIMQMYYGEETNISPSFIQKCYQIEFQDGGIYNFSFDEFHFFNEQIKDSQECILFDLLDNEEKLEKINQFLETK